MLYVDLPDGIAGGSIQTDSTEIFISPGFNALRLTPKPGLGTIFNLRLNFDNFIVINSNEIKLLSPNGYESWLANSTREITWTSQKVQNVNIEYGSTNGAKQIGWAVGDGNILRTIDGGSKWGRIYKNPYYRFFDIYFTDETNAWAVGEEISSGAGIVYRYQYNYWSLQRISGTLLRFVNFVNSQNGWVIGNNGIILNSTNGGNSWEEQNSNTDKNLYELTMLGLYKGWAVGQDGIILVYNGIYGWSAQISGINEDLFSVNFIDDKTGWAAGANGTIIQTINGGEDWVALNADINVDINRIYFNNSQLGWALGNDGIFIRTSDGGKTWLKASGNVEEEITSFYFTSSKTGWITSSDGVIHKTTNGGLGWIPQRCGTTNVIRSIYFKGEKWRTIVENTPSDGSYSWTVPNTPSNSVSIRISETQTPNIYDISDRAFKITPILHPEVLLVKPDGGEKWKYGTLEQITWDCQEAEKVKIELSIDNGISFETIADNIYASYKKYDWAVPDLTSEECIIAISSVEGNSSDWSNEPFTINTSPIPSIQLIEPDGGESWTPTSNQKISWVVAHIEGVKIEYSYDDGVNWIIINENVPAPIREYEWEIPYTPSTKCKIRVSDAFNPDLLDVNDSSFVIVDAMSVEDESSTDVPIKFSLSQNFPNPFNPQTTIFYSIPEAAFVRIKVYDIIGNEIKVLASEQKTAGKHMVIFDGSNFNSGIYFYRIQAGRYSETRKMLLIK